MRQGCLGLARVRPAAGAMSIVLAVPQSPPLHRGWFALIAACLAGILGGCVGPPLDLGPTDLPNAVVGRTYSVELDTDSESVTWRVTRGRVPDGLELNSAGRLSGRANEAGEFTFTIRADSTNLPTRTGEQSFTLVVRERLTISASLPAGRVDVPYSFAPTISGGVPSYSVIVVGLPAGLAANAATGAITGTPVTANSGTPVEFTVSDTDDPAQTADTRPTLVIKPRNVQIVTSVLDSARVGQSYTARLAAVDGRTPYLWSIVDGVLPSGLALNRNTGVISGAPTTEESRIFTVRVGDADDPQSVDEQQFTLVAATNPVVIASTTLPAAPVSNPYNAVVQISGGTPPYQFTVRSGTLPPGIVLDAVGGALSGTPTASGVFYIHNRSGRFRGDSNAWFARADHHHYDRLIQMDGPPPPTGWGAAKPTVLVVRRETIATGVRL